MGRVICKYFEGIGNLMGGIYWRMQTFEDFAIFMITVFVSFCYCCEVLQKDFI